MLYLPNQIQMQTNQTPPFLVTLLLLSLLKTVTPALLFSQSSSFGTIQIKLTTTTGFISASSDDSFQIANPAFSNIGSIGLALCGYDVPASPALQFRAQGSFDDQSNSFIVVLLPANSTTFYFVNYFLLVSSNDAAAYLYVDNPCINANFNVSNPSFYNRQYSYTIAGPLTTTNNVTPIPFLRSLSSIANSSFNYYNITSVTYSNNQATITVFLNYSLVSQVCLSIIYYNQPLASSSNVFLNTSSAQGLSLTSAVSSLTLATISQASFGINSIYGPNFIPKCVVGFRSLKLQTNSRQTLSFNMSGSGIYDLISSNSYEVNYNYFCAADIKCPSTNYQYYPVINDCEPQCVITNCAVCSTSTSCQLCQPGFYMSVLYRCLPCIANCRNCTNNTICQFCFDGFYFDPISLKCQSCSLYCLTCSISICSACQDGYFNSSTSCVKCSSQMSGCLQCTTGTYCNTCPNGTYFINGGCQTCSAVVGPGCLNCSAFYCFGCSSGYYLSGASCLNCTISQTVCCSFFVANCASCVNATACKICQIGFFLTGQATCQNCSAIANCLTCSNGSTCLTCVSGYVLNGAGCASCAGSLPNCQSCQNVSFCLICNSPFLTVNGLCYNCPSWPTNQLFYLDPFNNCVPCTSVRPNCAKCANSTTCIVCSSLYYLSSNSCFSCSQAIPNCLSCLSASACSICGNGYYVDPSNLGSCLLCGSQIGNCLSCVSTYFTALGSWVLSCTRCLPQYFINKTQCSSCMDAVPFCLVCLNSYQCQQCVSNYYLSSTLSCINCSSLMPGCTACNSAQCLSCALGYYLVNSYCTLCSMAVNYCSQCSLLNGNISCQVCLSGYYLSINFACVPCNTSVPFCILCANATACLSCLPGYVSSLTNNTCQLCATLLPSCLYCNPNLACQKCLDNYLLDSNGECRSCSSSIQGCDRCGLVVDSKSDARWLNCTACLSGYLSYLSANSGKCIACNASIFYCSTCFNLTTCKVCTNTSFLNDKGTCSLCTLYLANCLYCANNSVCLTCAPGYYSAANYSCLLCDPLQFGLTATQQPVCKECRYLNNTAQCTSCAQGYYSQKNGCGLCSASLPFCGECSSESLCDACQSGYYLSQNWQCLQCDSSLQNCSSCSSEGICFECKASYYLNSSLNKCSKCSSKVAGCLTCSSNGSCLSCQDGFYQSGEACASCSSALANCAYCYNASNCVLKVSSPSNAPPITTLNWYIYFIVILIIIAISVAGAIWWRKAHPPSQLRQLEKTGVISDTQRELINHNKDDGLVDQIKVEEKLCHGCKTKPPFWMNLQLLCKQCQLRPTRGHRHKIRQEFKKKKRVRSMNAQPDFQQIGILAPKPSQLQHNATEPQVLMKKELQRQKREQPETSALRQKPSLDIMIQPLSNETNHLEIFSKIESQAKDVRSQQQQRFIEGKQENRGRSQFH